MPEIGEGCIYNFNMRLNKKKTRRIIAFLKCKRNDKHLLRMIHILTYVGVILVILSTSSYYTWIYQQSACVLMCA